MTPLPIEKYKDDLIQALREYDTLIVVGDTGSGKTTQIPKYILSIASKVFLLFVKSRLLLRSQGESLL